MRRIFRFAFLIAALLLSNVLPPDAAEAEPVNVTTSTQFLWGDDLLGNSQAIFAQYLKLNYNPEARKYAIAGYGRFWQDFGDPGVRSDDFKVRLYYLHLDYVPWENVSAQIGRQYTNFIADSFVMDGATVNIHNIAKYIGVTIAGGWDVKYTLDGEFESGNNFFGGIDIHLENVKATQLGVSYVRRYDDKDVAREEFGLNARYIFKNIIPYAEIKYDRLSDEFNEATVGVDLIPISNLAVKAEFFHYYPTFDATSIYSVFAVDKFQEYLISAEYSLPKTPFSFFGNYRRQTYEEGSNADVFAVGARFLPSESLSLYAFLDYRRGYDDRNWGFEVTGDYRVSNKILVAGGVQHNTYKRPVNDGEGSAQRYWVGGKWQAMKNMVVAARLEDNTNENFDHRTLGRVTLDWKL